MRKTTGRARRKKLLGVYRLGSKARTLTGLPNPKKEIW